MKRLDALSSLRSFVFPPNCREVGGGGKCQLVERGSYNNIEIYMIN